jgi:hypothetical protein
MCYLTMLGGSQKPGFYQNLWFVAETVSETRFLKSLLTRFEWLITGWVDRGENPFKGSRGSSVSHAIALGEFVAKSDELWGRCFAFCEQKVEFGLVEGEARVAFRLFANQLVILGVCSNPKPRNAVFYFNTQSTVI